MNDGPPSSNAATSVIDTVQHSTDSLSTTIHQAFELHNLQSNSSLLDYGLQMGLIENRSNSGRFAIELLNAFIMRPSNLVENMALEIVLRLFVFVPATCLIKTAIDAKSNESKREKVLTRIYLTSIILHQIVNSEEVSIRSMNRLLMCVAIVFMTQSSNAPCPDMIKFKEKFRRRIMTDYLLWCLISAMNFVLTIGSPILINLELADGVDLHLMHAFLSSFFVIDLGSSMQLIGRGRLTPLVIGTPLLLLDSGEDITHFKALSLTLCYFCFWCSDWRELIDWDHALICEAGVCKVLAQERGRLMNVAKKAKSKFDEWRLEEGLDDDGWFLLVDPPVIRSNRSTNRPQHPDDNQRADHQGSNNCDNNQPRSEMHSQNREVGSSSESDEEEDGQSNPQLVELDRDRVIYLQSRHPLLITLAIFILIVLK